MKLVHPLRKGRLLSLISSTQTLLPSLLPVAELESVKLWKDRAKCRWPWALAVVALKRFCRGGGEEQLRTLGRGMEAN